MSVAWQLSCLTAHGFTVLRQRKLNFQDIIMSMFKRGVNGCVRSREPICREAGSICRLPTANTTLYLTIWSVPKVLMWKYVNQMTVPMLHCTLSFTHWQTTKFKYSRHHYVNVYYMSYKGGAINVRVCVNYYTVKHDRALLSYLNINITCELHVHMHNRPTNHEASRSNLKY